MTASGIVLFKNEFNYQDDPSDGPRVPLELDVLRPRASQFLLPEAILASRSLIRLGIGPSLGPSSLEPGKSR